MMHSKEVFDVQEELTFLLEDWRMMGRGQTGNGVVRV